MYDGTYWMEALHYKVIIIGVSRNCEFFAQNLRYFTQNFVFANFSHEAEHLLRNIAHCSASHATSFLIFAQNNLCDLQKIQYCAKLFSQTAKLHKIQSKKN